MRIRHIAVLLGLISCLAPGITRGQLRAVVEREEVVTTYRPANNGAGPMWCYGSTCITRQGGDVYVSAIQTGEDVPLLCNTRWQLWHRRADGWTLVQHESAYRQREPCPLAGFHDGSLFLSVNPSTEPPGVKYGPCHPLVLEFDPRNLTASPKTHEPVWADGTSFTDHSYRGFAADGSGGELLLLNINNKTSAQFVSYRDANGTWHAKGRIHFPIRACYPEVGLRDRSAHVMAIGDIVEPNEAWRKLKFKKLNRKWDYVFRRLFYTYTPDITQTAFVTPIEVDTVEETGGHITNLDLYIDADHAAHLLYLKRPHQYGFLRDRYFPGQTMSTRLEYVIVKAGKVVSRRTLAESPSETPGLSPSYARFHITPGGTLYCFAAGTLPDESGQAVFGNFIARILPGPKRPTFARVAMKHPFGSFFTTTPRGGSKPSDRIELFGIADDGPKLRYASVRVTER